MSSLNPSCEKCPLHIKASTVCMAGRGDSDGPLVAFVGSAPGREENVSGEPFVGPAGQLLQQAVDQYNLKPSFYTSSVRCFPGQNARGQDIKPNAEQIKACKPYLEKEINKIRPRYIVAVGDLALTSLTGKSGITAWAGRVVGSYLGIPVFAMLHPSYILRVPAQLPRFEAHVRALSDLVHKKAPKKLPEVERLEPADMKELLLDIWRTDRKTAVAFDYETTGISPWDGNHIRTVAFSKGKVGYWMKVEDDPKAHDVLRWFLKSPVLKSAQNLVFESVWSLCTFGTMPKNWAHDPMLYAHLIDEDGPKALDLMAAKEFGAPDWDIAGKIREKGWFTEDGDLDYGRVPIEELGHYNGIDAVYTADLVPVLRARLTTGMKSVYEKILLPLSELCARMQFRGLHIDTKWANRVSRKYEGEMSAEEDVFLRDPAVRRFIANRGDKPINLRSPVQMSKLLFGYMKLPVGPLTDGGAPSAAAEYLEKLPNPPPALTSYLKWKERETVCGKYLYKFPKFADSNDIIHAHHNPARIVTGRVAVADPPLQNVPEGVVVDGKSDGLVRGMFNSRFPGGKIISSDYKALEFRLVCSEAEETEFIQAFVSGMDPHAVTAKDLFGPNFTPDQRGKAKVTNFSLIYGTTEYSLGPKLGVPQDEAARIIVRFKKKHPKIFVWMERQFERVRKEKIAINRFGRVRHLPDVSGMDKWRAEEVLRQAGNFPIQSAGADITNLAILEVDWKCRTMGMKSKVVLNHHDSIMVDAHPEEVQQIKALLVKVMQEEIPGRLDWLRVPLQVDLKVCDRWGGAEWQSPK